MAAALCLLLVLGAGGCAKKNVRHLASDVGMITPGQTTKQEVFNYLGQPDAEFKMSDGSLLWVYHESRKSIMRDTPYIGEKIGDETYDVVKVFINDDIVRDVEYRAMSPEEFRENGISE